MDVLAQVFCDDVPRMVDSAIRPDTERLKAVYAQVDALSHDLLGTHEELEQLRNAEAHLKVRNPKSSPVLTACESPLNGSHSSCRSHCARSCHALHLSRRFNGCTPSVQDMYDGLTKDHAALTTAEHAHSNLVPASESDQDSRRCGSSLPAIRSPNRQHAPFMSVCRLARQVCLLEGPCLLAHILVLIDMQGDTEWCECLQAPE
jgi:hypothetical protein